MPQSLGNDNVESPEMLSLMGYSLATESGQILEGIKLCKKAVLLNPHNSDYFLRLGQIYVLAGQKENAIKIFRRGLRIRKDNRIIAELKKLGIRKTPHFSSLDRGHILNKVAGKLLHAFKLH
jgi:tetratricopeptide (TPR) repeat protein